MPHKDRNKYLEYHKNYWRTHSKQVKDRKLKKEFGISLETYNDILVKQHGVCAICNKPETAVHGKAKRVQNLAVDHRHSDNKIRGLLCGKCNTALGLLDESIERALALINYLERTK